MEHKKLLFNTMDKHLQEDNKPSEYFEGLNKTNIYSEYPFTMLGNLVNTEQSPEHHPEGSVWNHTMLVINEAAQVKTKSRDSRAFMWAALLHDIGKPDTTRNRKGKITSYDHDKLGAQMAREFLRHFYESEVFIEKVTALVRWHMQILFVVKSLPFADIESMNQQACINDIALLGLCDRLGRLNANKEDEEENIRLFLEKSRINK